MIDREFDVASSNGLPPRARRRPCPRLCAQAADGTPPTCRSCRCSSTPITRRTSRRRGAATSSARRSARRSRAIPRDARIGIAGSGGLSHFVVDEELDRGIIDALRAQGRRGVAIIAAQKAQFRQLRDPHVDQPSAAPSSISTWPGRIMSRATARRPGPAPGSVSPSSSEIDDEQTEGQRGSAPRRPWHGYGRDDAAILAAGGDVVGTASATARRCG